VEAEIMTVAVAKAGIVDEVVDKVIIVAVEVMKPGIILVVKPGIMVVAAVQIEESRRTVRHVLCARSRFLIFIQMKRRKMGSRS